MALQITSVNWREVPNSRERLIFFAALLAFILVFLRSCWFPSREALLEVQAHLEEALKEKAAFLQAQKQLGAQFEEVEPNAGSAVLASYEPMAHKIARNPSGWVMQEITNHPLLTKGLQVTGVEFKDPVRQGRVTIQEFTVSLLGSFPFLGRYLERLDRLSAPLLIPHWEIASSEEGVADVKLTLEGVVYGWE